MASCAINIFHKSGIWMNRKDAEVFKEYLISSCLFYRRSVGRRGIMGGYEMTKASGFLSPASPSQWSWPRAALAGTGTKPLPVAPCSLQGSW